MKMKKVLDWILNHLKIVAAILTFSVTLVVVGLVMLNSYNSYKDYEARYNANDLEARSLVAAAPKSIEINDSFKSSLKNTLDVKNDQLTKEEGKLSITLDLAKTSLVDIDFVIYSIYEPEDPEAFYGMEDLLGTVNFIVNGEKMEEDISLATDYYYHHLVMKGFALPAGDLSIEVSAKAELLPEVSNIIVYSNEIVSFKA